MSVLLSILAFVHILRCIAQWSCPPLRPRASGHYPGAKGREVLPRSCELPQNRFGASWSISFWSKFTVVRDYRVPTSGVLDTPQLSRGLRAELEMLWFVGVLVCRCQRYLESSRLLSHLLARVEYEIGRASRTRLGLSHDSPGTCLFYQA